MRIVVTGGAGYIGLHLVPKLLDAGHHVVVLDNGQTGCIRAVDKRADLRQLDIRERDVLAAELSYYKIDLVIHLAGLVDVRESVEKPAEYYLSNTGGTAQVLWAMERSGCTRLVFTSSCAVYGDCRIYGDPKRVPAAETDPTEPLSPYGKSKIYAENAIQDYGLANSDFGCTILRLFNVAGISLGGLPDYIVLQDRLIPKLVQAGLKGEQFKVRGICYPTKDGTSVRDYVHVDDVCELIVREVEEIRPSKVDCYNVGSGQGYSVYEMMNVVEKVLGRTIRHTISYVGRGDVSSIVADTTRIRLERGWSAKRSIEDIVYSVVDAQLALQEEDK